MTRNLLSRLPFWLDRVAAGAVIFAAGAAIGTLISAALVASGWWGVSP